MAKRDGEGRKERERGAECAGEIRVSSVSSVRCLLSFSSGRRRAVKVDNTRDSCRGRARGQRRL